MKKILLEWHHGINLSSLGDERFFVYISVHFIKRGLIDNNINIELYLSVRLNQGGTAELNLSSLTLR